MTDTSKHTALSSKDGDISIVTNWQQLLDLIDKVWNAATESEEVPHHEWASRIINDWMPEPDIRSFDSLFNCLELKPGEQFRVQVKDGQGEQFWYLMSNMFESSSAHETKPNAPETGTGGHLEKLETALRGLYWDNVDYLTLNHLGGMDNHWMKAAREALGIQPTHLKAGEQQFNCTCGEPNSPGNHRTDGPCLAPAYTFKGEMR